MTARKKESALGRGLDALIRPEINDIDETDNKLKKTELNKPNSKNIKKK